MVAFVHPDSLHGVLAEVVGVREQAQCIQLAFEGGQIVGAIVAPASPSARNGARSRRRRIFELETEDGSYLLPLARIVYVRRFARETRSVSAAPVRPCPRPRVAFSGFSA